MPPRLLVLDMAVESTELRLRGLGRERNGVEVFLAERSAASNCALVYCHLRVALRLRNRPVYGRPASAMHLPPAPADRPGHESRCIKCPSSNSSPTWENAVVACPTFGAAKITSLCPARFYAWKGRAGRSCTNIRSPAFSTVAPPTTA